MKRNFDQFKVGGILIVVILSLVISGCFRRGDNTDPQSDDSANPDIFNQPVAKPSATDYQQSLQQIFSPYWTTGQTAGIKEQILDLTTPVEYVNLHFNLVVAFELIEQGNLKDDSIKINQGVEKLNQLRGQFDWLNDQ